MTQPTVSRFIKMNDLELIREMKVKLLKQATKPKSAHADYETGKSSGKRTKPGRDITDPGKISKAMKIKRIFKALLGGREEGTKKHSKLAAKIASQNVLFRGASANPTKEKKPVKARDLASKNVLFKEKK